MRSVYSIFILILFYSCASSKNTSKNFSDISNEDFKTVEKNVYRRSNDVLKNVKSEFTEALNEESLERVISYGGDFETKDDLDKISLLCHKAEFKSAYELVKKRSRAFIENPIFWNEVGNCFLQQKQFRKALLFYNRSLGIKDDYVPALNNLGIMYLRKGDQTRALVAFKRAINSDHYAKTPRFNLALIHLSYGLFLEARKNLEILYKDNHSDVDVLNMLATSHLMEGNAEASLTYYSKIKSKYSSRMDIGTNYALALFISGKKDQARSVLSDIDKTKNVYWEEYNKKVIGIVGE